MEVNPKFPASDPTKVKVIQVDKSNKKVGKIAVPPAEADGEKIKRPSTNRGEKKEEEKAQRPTTGKKKAQEDKKGVDFMAEMQKGAALTAEQEASKKKGKGIQPEGNVKNPNFK